MKIVIKGDESKRKLRFWIPTRIIKWKWIYSLVYKHSSNEKTKELAKIFQKDSKKIYKSIKKYIRKNGHFVLVDVNSNDGSIVRIKV